MSGVGFDISPSRNFNLVTPEKTTQVNNQWVDLKLGFGSRVSTNTYTIKKESPYKKYYYYDRDGIVNSEKSYFNVVDDPLQGEILVFGNNKDAREPIIGLIQEIGMKGWHAGSIDNSVVAESMTSALIFMNKFYNMEGAGINIVDSSLNH